ncbi:MAG: glycosyltransferase family 4 protein [Candidatus Hodarchaeota archaeon]
MEIKTFIGQKLNYINGILRVHIELSKPLKDKKDLKFTYEYYDPPKNSLDYLSKRYLIYPFSSHFNSKRIKEDVVFNISFQHLADLGFFLNRNRTIITCADIYIFIGKRKPWIIKKYLISGLKRCKYIIAISDFTKNELTKFLGISEEKITVIKCGVNREIFKPIPQNKINELAPLYPEYRKILHVGTEVGRKDFLTLLKAFYIVKKKEKKVKLVRVGTPSYPNLIKNLGLENDVIYLTNIRDKRLIEIYNLCDFFVFPSLYEGFGLPGLEAAACGIPVMCSDIPIFREIYQDFPIYFPPKDFKSLANLLLESINNDSLKSKIINSGYELIKKYSWKKSSEIYYNLAKKIVENN